MERGCPDTCPANARCALAGVPPPLARRGAGDIRRAAVRRAAPWRRAGTETRWRCLPGRRQERESGSLQAVCARLSAWGIRL